MHVPYNRKFEEQKARYGFCFTCEECVHFESATGECIHEFPNQMHRSEHYTTDPPPEIILFCKDFDLG